jgi:hypothetical protein
VFKRIQTSIILACAFVALWPHNIKAQEGAFLGTVVRTSAASYVLQMDDGNLLYAEWNSGYEDWSNGDSVFLSTESGEGFMFYGDRRSQVDVSSYNPAEN